MSLPIGEYLTQEEVEALPPNILVEVTWSGGNGPHIYETVRAEYNRLYVQSPGNPPYNYRHNLDFVGKERYHTRVRIVS